jgi:coenzyme F420-dependent glucose-6-phosphate dehydrogenase
LWPSAAMAQSGLELPLPTHFEELALAIREEDVAKAILCSADPELHADKVREYFRAGYDRVFVHQVGADQEGFFRFYEREVFPRLSLDHPG